MLYRKLSPVNWCPKENIALSNEQASGGVCWRDGTPVVQKELMQWFARITDYADQLLQGLDQLEGGWPERVITMQRNWIGRSQGAEVRFIIEGAAEAITVFTTRIDTIFGANAIILAPEHRPSKNSRGNLIRRARLCRETKKASTAQRQETERKAFQRVGKNPFTRSLPAGSPTSCD